MVDRYHMDVGVGHLESGDDHADTSRGKHRHLRPANAVGDRGEMGNEAGAKVGPLVGFLARNDEDVAWSQRSNVEERNALVVLPKHARGDLAVDDA